MRAVLTLDFQYFTTSTINSEPSFQWYETNVPSVPSLTKCSYIVNFPSIDRGRGHKSFVRVGLYIGSYLFLLLLGNMSLLEKKPSLVKNFKSKALKNENVKVRDEKYVVLLHFSF